MNQSFETYLKPLLVFLCFSVLSLLLSLTYFSPILQGKKIYQSDIVQYTGMAKQQLDFKNETGKETYWTNSAFGGMPTYQLGAKYPHNYIKKLDLKLRFLPRPADYLFLYLMGFYILLLTLGIDFRTAVLGALAFGFSTYLIIIIGVGHNAKAHAIAYMPLVLSGIFLTFQKRYILGFIITTLSVGLELVANHFQMTYYLLFVILFLGVAQLVKSYRDNEIPNFLKSALILIVAAGLAVGMNATNLLTTSEYAKQSTRSQSELTVLADGSLRPQTTGLNKDYITQYSYGILESLNLFIPRLLGGGNSEELGKDSYTYKAYKDLGASSIQALNEVKRAPMYWGAQPIVEAPAYLGATVIFLCFLGLLLYKGFHKWWLLLAIILALLLSYGKNLPWLTNVFIDHIPFYNKFRAVSSIQVVIELCIPILAVFGLTQLFKPEAFKKNCFKALKIALLTLSGICLIFILFKNSLFDFVGLRDGQYASYLGQDFVEALRKDRSALLTADALRSLLFILFMAAVIWGYLKHKINQNITVVVLGLLILLDLAGVDRRYVNNDNFRSAIKVDKPYQANEIDKLILRDTTVFRIYDNSDGSTKASYFHNSISGYHAAKMRRFNELIEFHIDKGNPEVFNMLNTKYIIYSNDEGQLQYVENEQINGNAWFIETLKSVADADAEIKALSDFDSKSTAIVNIKSHPDAIFKRDSTASIQLVGYAPNKLIYKSINTNDGFAVFSENYYKNGWQVQIDNAVVPHYNVNYVQRGLKIPKGIHTIVFEFKPQVVQSGAQISLISSILFLILSLGALSLVFSKKSK
tara:strand:- start:9762 stop:12185 length:2424 start_codon:yes stop_codon:yes gene_type:complete